MARIRIRPSIIVDVQYPNGRHRRYKGRNLFTDYGLWLLMFWAFGQCEVLPSPDNASGWNISWSGLSNMTLGPGTTYNDGVNVYPTPFQCNTGPTGPASVVSNGSGGNAGIVLVNQGGVLQNATPWQILGGPGGIGAGAADALQAFGFLPAMGAILVATSDSSPVSETTMVWPSGTTCLWANTDSGVSVSTASTWTLTGSTSTPTPPVASWVFQDTTTAKTAISIQSFGWTLPFVVGSVSSGTFPGSTSKPNSVYTTGSGTSIANWPIISKVIPSGAPINVPAGGKLTVTYTFTLSN